MPFFLVRDLKIYYETRGTGPRLLVITGTGGDLRHRPNILDTPVARYFEVLTYDQRGLGRTSRPDIPYTMSDYAADADALLDANGWDCCLVMGISFGGMVAQEFALRYPHRVTRLVLACTSSGGAGGNSYPLHEFADLPAEEYADRLIELSDLRRNTAWRVDHPAQFQALFDFTLAGLRVGAGERGRAIGLRRQLEARALHNTFDRLPALQMPVYLCGGRYDGIATPANLRAMHRQIPGATLELFEGGHLFFIQDPRAFDRIVLFLRGELGHERRTSGVNLSED